jgi:hypothetical protein
MMVHTQHDYPLQVEGQRCGKPIASSGSRAVPPLFGRTQLFEYLVFFPFFIWDLAHAISLYSLVII